MRGRTKGFRKRTLPWFPFCIASTREYYIANRKNLWWGRGEDNHTPIGGLNTYQLYNVVKVDDNRLYLTTIEPTLENGLYIRMVTESSEF
jgi:hypothetical protein